MDTKLLKRLEEVIRVEATITSAEDFLATHMPFKNLKYYNSGEPIDITKEYKENDFFQEFMLDNNDKHSFIIVEGKSGAGKSHFIRWLKYRYENEIDVNKEVSILIERSQNTLQGAIKQIIEEKNVKDLLDKNEIDKLTEASSNLSSEKLKYTIINAFITEVQSEDDEDSILKNRQRKMLATFLQDPIVQEKILFKENGPIERIKNKLSSNDNKAINEIDITFNEDDFEFGFDSEIMRSMCSGEDRSAESAIKCAENIIENRRNLKSLIIQYLNSKIDNVIQSCIKLSSQDFTQIFIKLRKELKKQNKKLTLFIEDLTSFTGIDKALVETLIIDHNGDESICRLFSVVGITTAYYNSHFPDNLKARVTGRIVIDDKSIIVDENDIFDMSARYLNAVYLDKEILKSWVRHGALDEELPISKKNKDFKWCIYKDKLGREFSLFPFNKNALNNLYNTLEYKTPRAFLKEVIKKVFVDYIKEPKNFPPSEKDFQGSFKVPAWRDPLHQQIVVKQIKGYDAERLSCFLRIWGDKTVYRTINNNKEYLGGVPKEVYDGFNIPFIEGILTEQKKPLSHLKNIEEKNVISESKIVVNTSLNNHSKNNTILPQVNTEIDKKREIFDKKMNEIDGWYRDDKIFKDHIRYRDDIARVIKDFINWDFEDVSSLIVDAFLTKSRIHIRGQKVQVDKGFVLERNEENYYFLQAITAWRYLGDASWDFEDSLGYLTNLTNWIIKNKKQIIDLIKTGEAIEDDNVKLENWDMLKWGIYNEFILNIINGNIVSSNKNNIKKIFDIIFQKDFHIDFNKVQRLPKLDKVIEGRSEDLKQNHEFVIRYYNCILGEARPETTSNFYLDAYEILKCIDELVKVEWDLKKIEIPIVKESLSKWKTTYRVINGLWKDKLDIVLNNIMFEVEEDIKKIQEIVNYSPDQQENINDLFVEFRNFLTKRIQSVNETYSDIFDDIISEQITGKTVTDSIKKFEKVKEQKEDIIERLIYAISKKINIVKKLYNLLHEMELYVDMKYNKFIKKTEDLKCVDEEFNVERDNFNSYVVSIEKALESCRGDNVAINR